MSQLQHTQSFQRFLLKRLWLQINSSALGVSTEILLGLTSTRQKKSWCKYSQLSRGIFCNSLPFKHAYNLCYFCCGGIKFLCLVNTVVQTGLLSSLPDSNGQRMSSQLFLMFLLLLLQNVWNIKVYIIKQMEVSDICEILCSLVENLCTSTTLSRHIQVKLVDVPKS